MRLADHVAKGLLCDMLRLSGRCHVMPRNPYLKLLGDPTRTNMVRECSRGLSVIVTAGENRLARQRTLEDSLSNYVRKAAALIVDAPFDD